MLVLLSPEFNGSDVEIVQLAHSTGLLPYDLRTRLRPGAWGVLKVLADLTQAESLVAHLNALGFQAVAVDSSVGHDPERKVVYLRRLDIASEGIVLGLSEREMVVPFGALVTIVRGEVHLGRSQRGNVLGSSGQVRPTPALGPWASGNLGADNTTIGDGRNPGVTDVFAAADLHFATVRWVARIDARELEFPTMIPPQTNVAERLDMLVDWLADQAKIRVDRHLRVSSLGSQMEGTRIALSGPKGSTLAARRGTSPPSDEHFDAYSRLIAEAERRQRGHVD